MIIKRNEEAKRIEIWVDASEQHCYKQSGDYQKAVAEYKNPHSIFVFVGGSKPLLPTIMTLLDAQIQNRLSKVG